MKTFIKDLKVGHSFDTQFLLVDFQLKNKRDGGKYLSLELMDKSGSLKGNMWDNFLGLVDVIQKNDVVAASGVVQEYQGRTQVTISRMQRLDLEQVNLSDFVTSSKADIQALWAQVKQRMDGMKTPALKDLLKAIFTDERVKKFLAAPAAKALHNAYRGGLIEHVYSLLLMSEAAHAHYKALGVDFNLELVQTGILLHDLMKTEELSYELSIDYTDVGHLIGHLPMALQLIERHAAEISDFPSGLKLQLDHIVLSHHGELEYGSPVIPQTVEALVVSYLDQLDSRMWGYQALKDRKEASSNWTDSNRMFATQLFVPNGSS